MSSGPKGSARGTIAFDHCRFEDAGWAGITVDSNPADGAKIVFADCVVADSAEHPSVKSPIVFKSHKEDRTEVGGVTFDGLTIKETTDRPLMKYYNVSGRRILGLAGRITVERKGKRMNYLVDQALADRLVPVHSLPAKAQKP